MPFEFINSYALDTPFGARSFVLYGGDICDSTADAFVLSAEAASPSPLGAAINSVVDRFGTTVLDDVRRLFTFDVGERFSLGPRDGEEPTRAGLYHSSASGRQILIARVPSADEIVMPDEAYRTVVEAVFGGLSLLAFTCERPMRSVALTELSSKRGFAPRESLATILRFAERWLQHDVNCERVEVVLYDPWAEGLEKKKEAWRTALNDLLQRSDRSAADPQSDEFRRSLRDQVRRLRLSVRDQSAFQSVLADLEAALDPEHPRTVQEVAAQGRRLAEAISGELCTHYGCEVSRNAFDNIESLGKSGRISQWVLYYMHTLRTLGNEAVHVTSGQRSRYPRTLGADDLLVLLANIRRVLDFRSRWAVDAAGEAAK